MAKQQFLDNEGLNILANEIIKNTIQSLSISAGSNSGTIKLTIDGIVYDNIPIKGLGSAAYVSKDSFAVASPTFTTATALSNISSGEKLTVMLGKISRGLTDFISHKSDTIAHLTAAERTNWNDSNSKKHSHSNKNVIDTLTQAMLDKLNKISAGAEVNVQSDWNVADVSSDAYIKNKPISLPANGGTASKLSNAIQINDYDTFIPSKVATGSITPIKGNADSNSPWNNTNSGYLIQSNSADSWHIVIFRSGGDGWAYRSYYQNKWGAWRIWSTFDGAYNSLTGKPSSFPPSAHTHIKSQITDFPVSLPANGGNSATVNGHTVDSNVPSGAKFTDTIYTHPNSGVTAGTYKSVAVNAQGHITTGTNPTTLSGYGITDAAPKTHTHPKSQITDFPLSLKNPNSLTLSLNGASQGAYDGSSSKSINITAASVGAAAVSHGTHVSFTTTVPMASGTPSSGTAATVSRSDHVHPKQTTCDTILKNIIIKADSFSSLVATYNNTSILDTHVADVFFAKESLETASKAKITVETSAGQLKLTAKKIPTADLVIETLFLRNTI